MMDIETFIWSLKASWIKHFLQFENKSLLKTLHEIDFKVELLKQGYRYHKLCKTFSKFYRRHYDLVSKFNTRLKSLLKPGLSEPEFNGDLVNLSKLLVEMLF